MMAVWPERAVQNRHDLLASALVYVLLKVILSVWVGLVMMGQGGLSPQEMSSESEPTPGIFMLALVMLGVTVWAFRFLWLYIPVALGFGMRDFIRAFKGFASSYYMIGLWVLCFTPLAVVMMVCSEGVALVIPGAHEEQPSVLYVQTMAIFQAVMDYVISLVSSVGMAYGIYAVLTGRKPDKT